MKNNYYIGDAILLYRISILNIQGFKCFNNNEFSTTGGTCIKFIDMGFTSINDFKVISNFANSNACGFIFDQTGEFNIFFPTSSNSENAQLKLSLGLFF
jgi:hypothetical protein